MPRGSINTKPVRGGKRGGGMINNGSAGGGGSTTITWIASSAQADASGNGTDITIPIPTGLNGDLRFLLIVGATTGINLDYQTPAGWTLINHTLASDTKKGVDLFARVRQAGDADSVTVVGNPSSAGQFSGGSGHCFRGQPATFLDTVTTGVTGADLGGAPGNVTPAVNNTTVTDTMIVFTGISSSGTTGITTATGGWTRFFDANVNTTIVARHAVFMSNTDLASGAITGPTCAYAGTPSGFAFAVCCGIKIA